MKPIHYIAIVIALNVAFGVGALIGRHTAKKEMAAQQPNNRLFKSFETIREGDYWVTYPGGKPGKEYAISVVTTEGWKRIFYRDHTGKLHFQQD